MADDSAEPSSPVSKQSGEYTLDHGMNDTKRQGKMNNKSPAKQPPPKASGKFVTCNVYLLDGENVQIDIDKNDVGRTLFEKVCERLDLIERDYFGLTYTDDRGPSHLKYWLNIDKKISKQKKRGAWVFEFALKFYPPDPTHLRESLTRWLVVLQVRRDLLSGRLPVTFNTYALLGSYNVQADIGEYDPNDHGTSHDYIKDMTFAPSQTPDLLEKIAELHKLHKGQTPDEAEKYFLDNAKKLAMYGVDLHKAKDSENGAIMIGVCASGILVYRDKLRINRFVWPKILKLSYKRNHFYIKIRPGELERNETTIMFKLDNHRLAKRLWKTCVEHHAFFRLREAEKPSTSVSFPRFGSKFRYSGRTLFQTRQNAELLNRPPPFFERSQPARNSMPADAANRSHSMDDMGDRARRDRYNDGMYDPNRRASQDYDKYGDERDRRDRKGVPTAKMHGGRDGDTRGVGDEDTLQRRPYGDDTADRRDRAPGHGDATLEREKGRGQGQGLDDSMGLSPGENIDGENKQESDKERRRREKEEDKKRKKEAEEKKKREDEERKRAKKKGAEDRIDKMGAGEATQTAPGGGPGSAGLDGGQDKTLTGHDKDTPHGKDGDKDKDGHDKDKDGHDKDKDGHDKDKPKKSFALFNLLKPGKHGDGEGDETGGSKKGEAGKGDKGDVGWPYGVGLGVGKGDMTGVVGKEQGIDNKQHFIPPPKPIKETKDSLKSGFTDNTMPFFHPAATSTVGRGKVPPQVPPKGSHGSEDSSKYKTEKNGVEETRVVQKVVMSGDEDEDMDFDAALADAIRSVTEFNPDMSVERIECVQQIEDVKDGK